MTLVRRIRSRDGELLRDVRLRALATDPLAFSSTLAREQPWAAEWNAWAAGHAVGDDHATFVALAEDGSPAGLAGGFRDGDDGVRFHLFSMWVAPDRRRCGHATRLVDAVAGWARAAGGRELCLYVTGQAAMRFYKRIGFGDDGRRMPLEHMPAVTEVGMTRSLL